MVSLGMMTTALVRLVTVVASVVVQIREPAAQGVWVVVEEEDDVEGVEVVARDDLEDLKFHKRIWQCTSYPKWT